MESDTDKWQLTRAYASAVLCLPGTILHCSAEDQRLKLNLFPPNILVDTKPRLIVAPHTFRDLQERTPVCPAVRPPHAQRSKRKSPHFRVQAIDSSATTGRISFSCLRQVSVVNAALPVASESGNSVSQTLAGIACTKITAQRWRNRRDSLKNNEKIENEYGALLPRCAPRLQIFPRQLRIMHPQYLEIRCGGRGARKQGRRVPLYIPGPQAQPAAPPGGAAVLLRTPPAPSSHTGHSW